MEDILGGKMLRVLVADDDAGLRLAVSSTLKNTNRFAVDDAVDGLHAIEKMETQTYDLVILDVDMPRLNGLETLKKIKEISPQTIVLIMTAYANINDAVVAVKEGAYNYLSKPVKGDDLIQLVDRSIEAHDMISSAAASSPVLIESDRKFVGKNIEMKKVFGLISRLSNVDTAVLIRGESGTGKELVARAIHFNSGRKDQKFVAINCSAIPENLFESELFGHEKGSFTGADQRKIGKFQYAEGGTLFLDEIGDMPLLMQAKLLRVLQEKVFTPVGANRELEANVRIIAATNKPLEKMIEDGSFREDLYYRLSVIPMFLPPLRDRKDDIETLLNMFITKFNKAHGKKMLGVTPEVMACFKKYGWPGNIRELENVMEYAFVIETSNKVTLHSLPEKVLKALGISFEDVQKLAQSSDESGALSLNDSAEPEIQAAGVEVSGELDFGKHKEMFEKEFIIKALKTFKGRINQTALHANIPKKTLLRKIEKYGINPRDYLSTS
jgi:two-component system response regulator HydG